MAFEFLRSEIEALRKQADDARRGLEHTLRAIDGDERLTPAAREDDKRNATAQTREICKSLLQQEKQLIATRKDELSRRLDSSTGTTSADVIAFRDAQDRADRIEDRETAERILARAIRSGDTSLSHAIFQKALDSSWDGIVNQFSEAHPDSAQVAQDLSTLNAELTDGQSVFARTVAYMVS